MEIDGQKVALATTNFARCGLSPFITLVHANAGELLGRSDDGSFDLIFLDSERTEYVRWWPELRRVLRQGGLLIVDNATSHATELAPLIAQVEADPGFISCLVPVGKGEFLATSVGRAD